ncbi:hypothetical protein [Paenibacillus naphthalenovorans]|uniref:Uncharacterized protein n=1 Tax=Paenibacillus naphthalenovorans TaxID=162209 RepID=A0A0U2VFF1_9BACL|nr:hypothetical protein [Paenibacillus naphthalenovorans]ALS22259.1 hypothetical protein IJ22_18850 [Paenibacillus naphthalenovorans]
MLFKINETYVAMVDENVVHFKVLDQVNNTQFLIQWFDDNGTKREKEVAEINNMIEWINDYKASIEDVSMK